MATRGAGTRERDRPGSSDTSRTRPCHEILHLGGGLGGVGRILFAPWVLLCVLGALIKGFISKWGPWFDGSLLEHSIFMSLSVSLLFLVLGSQSYSICIVLGFFFFDIRRAGTGKGRRIA